jgi:hypothetical protein
MTTERRAATRRFAFKDRGHGGPLGPTAIQVQQERPTSLDRRRQERTRSRHPSCAPGESDFPTDFPTADTAIEKSLQTHKDEHPPVTVSKTCSRIEVDRRLRRSVFSEGHEGS